MLPLFVALQVTPPPTPPPGYTPAPPPAATQPYQPSYAQPYPYPPYPYPYPQQATPYPSPYPYPYPYPTPQPQPYPAPPGSYPSPPPAEAQPPAPPKPPPRTTVSWFFRAQIGLGPTSFSEQSSLLRDEGFGGPKFWVDLDGGYFVHPNVALGLFAGLNLLRSSGSGTSLSYRESCYFIGGEVPLRVGSRGVSFVAAPRIGFAAGEESFGGAASTRPSLAWGGLLSATSFEYHLTGSIGYLRALSNAPSNTIGRALDFGGLQILVGGVIDG